MHRASIICRSLLINNFLIRGNDTLNYFWIRARDGQMTQFGERFPVLQGSWCVITQMLGVDQVLYVGLQLICAIMFHPAFHFEARTSWYASVALIIISAPLPFPCPVSLCHALSLNPGQPGCRSLRTWCWNAFPGHLQIGDGGGGGGGWELS